MADGGDATADPAGFRADAELAVARLEEMSADLRGCAILGADGRLLAASAPNSWEEAASEIWEAVEGAADGEPEGVHVGTERGELFAVRTAAGSALALSDRFTLASLMFCDLRAVLRDLHDGPEGGKGGGG